MTVVAVRPSGSGTVPWPDEAAAEYVARGYWEGRSLAATVVAAADEAPDAVAVVDGDVRLTYRELVSRADGLAMRLRGLGLAADDRVLLQLPNGWEFVVALLGCLRSGVIPVMALPAFRRHEMSVVAEQAEARAMLVPDGVRDFDHQAMALAIADESATVEHVLVAGERVRDECEDLRGLCRPADDPERARRELDRAEPDAGTVAVMLLSGGTTGLPKLIARTHNDYGCYARSLARIFGFGPESALLALLPLGHSLPLGTTLAALRSGGRIVIGPSPAPQEAFRTIEDEGVTAAALVPAVTQRWLEYRGSDAGRGHDLASLQVLLVGGARLADHVARQVAPTLGCTLLQGYGMAEGLACTTRVDDPEEVSWHSQGRPICAGDEVLLVDDEDRPVPDGEPGHLLTRGPSTPPGYYRAAEYNAGAFTADGWLRTGDIVRRRPDGNLVVEGRAKDMINRGGEKISAEEVENFAYQVAGVSLAAAVAMPDPDMGERVCLYVVPKPAATVTLADVKAVMMGEGVARFKLPERLELVDALPTTNVGKIDKKALRAAIADRITAETTAVRAAS